MKNFSIISNNLISNPRLSAVDLKIILSIKSFMNKKGYCFPHIATIATTAGVCYRTVTKSLKKLENLGILTRKNNFSNGAKLANTYYINDAGVRNQNAQPLGIGMPRVRNHDAHKTILKEEKLISKDINGDSEKFKENMVNIQKIEEKMKKQQIKEKIKTILEKFNCPKIFGLEFYEKDKKFIISSVNLTKKIHDSFFNREILEKLQKATKEEIKYSSDYSLIKEKGFELI